MFALFLHPSSGSVIFEVLSWLTPLIFAIFLAVRLMRQPRSADAAPFGVVGRAIVIAWASFLMLIAVTLLAAFTFPGAAWLPSPGLLLALCLMLMLLTFGFAIKLIFKAIVSRVKH